MARGLMPLKSEREGATMVPSLFLQLTYSVTTPPTSRLK